MMIEATEELVIEKAKELSSKGASWHFHILTPGCLLNGRQDYSLILEIPSERQTFIHYSPEKPMDAGKELVKLLHGSDVVQETPPTLSPGKSNIQEILDRVRNIHERGEFWHHHMLLPDCIFNKNKGKWTLILEDPQTKGVLESVTDCEPKEDLKQVETLFYSQQS